MHLGSADAASFSAASVFAGPHALPTCVQEGHALDGLTATGLRCSSSCRLSWLSHALHGLTSTWLRCTRSKWLGRQELPDRCTTPVAPLTLSCSSSTAGSFSSVGSRCHELFSRSCKRAQPTRVCSPCRVSAISSICSSSAPSGFWRRRQRGRDPHLARSVPGSSTGDTAAGARELASTGTQTLQTFYVARHLSASASHAGPVVVKLTHVSDVNGCRGRLSVMHRLTGVPPARLCSDLCIQSLVLTASVQPERCPLCNLNSTMMMSLPSVPREKE